METNDKCCREATPQEQIQRLNQKVYQLEGLIDILKQDYVERKLPKPKFNVGDMVIYKPNPIGKTQIETQIIDVSPQINLEEWGYSIFVFEAVIKVTENTLTLNG